MPPKRKLHSSPSGSPGRKKGAWSLDRAVNIDCSGIDSSDSATESSATTGTTPPGISTALTEKNRTRTLTWPHGWETFNDGERKECMIQSLSARFKYLHIEVEELCDSPELVHLISKPSEERETYTIQRDSMTCAEDLRKWLDRGDGEKLRKANMFLDVLTEAIESVAFDAVDETWYSRSLTKAKEDEARKTGGRKSIQGKMEKKAKSNPGDKKKNAPADRLEKHFTKELLSSFVVGVLHKMTNSKGRKFVESLLNAALYVSLEENNFSENSWVLSIGSSNTKDEGFPLKASKAGIAMKELTSPTLKQVVQKLDTLAGGDVTPRRAAASTTNIPSTPGTPAEAAEGSTRGMFSPPDNASVRSRGTKSLGPHCSGYVFPDLLVTSMLDSSTKCLLVVEVKSKSITAKEHTQLFREMLGAGMHQNVVFGLLINSLEAKIWKMEVDKKLKLVTFSQMLTYSLVRVGELLTFFKYLISIFDYTYNNVSEVKHE